jgi:2-polyprenyl-3-methyl-5-hydroxy-6-metoxy-1,4-benzoquinol methylase
MNHLAKIRVPITMKNNLNAALHPTYAIKPPGLAIPKPENIRIDRGETERHVNKRILENLVDMLPPDQSIKVLDLPCGNLSFLGYLRHIFPYSELTGADIQQPKPKQGIEFIQMDLTKEFSIPRDEQYDLITSISGVMMFSNTLSFIENCSSRLKKNGNIIISNDNSMTIMDRLRTMVLGRVRLFNPIYEDNESMVQNIPIMELIRLMRINGFDIEKIEYTSFYKRDLVYLPLALMLYPFQFLYLLKLNSTLARKLRWKAYPFRHLLCRHYFIIGKKRD